MSGKAVHFPRRRFLKTALKAGAALAAPQIIPGVALGKDDAVVPSQRIDTTIHPYWGMANDSMKPRSSRRLRKRGILF